MKIRNIFTGFMLMAAFMMSFTSCNQSPIAPADEFELKSATLSLPTVFPELISGEETGILLMREEEKMAHDVYLNLNSLWNLPVFENISKAETNHFNAIYTLLAAYGLTDPSTGAEGTFTNTELADLYAQLISQGSVSVEEALKAGAKIEEYDILDLEKLLSETDNSALIQIYGNLLRGSRNHLRAFVSTLSSYDVTYVPELMDQEKYDAIVNSPMETGNKNGVQNGNGNKNGQGNKKGNGKGKGNSGNGNSGNGNSGNGNSGNGNSSSRGNGTGTGVCVNG